MYCPNSNVFDEDQEADIELIYLPDLIDRNIVEFVYDTDDSSQASSNAYSQLPVHDMRGDEDDDRLVHDDVSCTGSENDMNDE